MRFEQKAMDVQDPRVGDDHRDLGHPLGNIPGRFRRDALVVQGVIEYFSRVASEHEDAVRSTRGREDAIDVSESGRGQREGREGELRHG